MKKLIRFVLILILNSAFLTFNCSAQFTKLHDFSDTLYGKKPLGSLYSDGTYLYGMTVNGGSACEVEGCGTIFKIKNDGTGFVRLWDFGGMINGSYPKGNLISDGTFLYGVSDGGGTYYGGVIFKIKPDGSGYSKVFDFFGTTEANPQGSLISDGIFLYGTANGGTNGLGAIFKIKPDGTGYSKLHDFSSAASGSYPSGSLISDGAFLYGMTTTGGTNNLGVVFKIKPDGTAYSKLFDFSGAANGRYPLGSLISDGIFLYGMTSGGGTSSNGVVFKIKPDGTGYSKLLDFAGLNGSEPHGNLLFGGNFLYGMTRYGGTNGLGVLFKIKPDGTGYSKLLDFTGSANGSNPYGSLFSDGNFFYGMTSGGGTNDIGTIFKYYPMSASATMVGNPVCYNQCSGSASAIVTQGKPPYTYLWSISPSQSTAIATGLCAGTYTVTVTDSMGGIASNSVTITSYPALSASFTTTNASCNLICNGSTSATITGGTAPYHYLWPTNGDTTSSSSNLCAGPYTLNVTDAHSCTKISTVSINSNPIMIASFTKTNISCYGGSNGTATVSITNGTLPFSYLWINGQTNQMATGLSATTYSVEITDANGCSILATTNITQPNVLSASPSVISNASCYNNDGSATLTLNGGSPPYSYLWSNSNTTQTISEIGVGTYSVMATDNNGCTTADSIVIGRSSIAPPTPAICMVTVDSLSINNEIYWDKTLPEYSIADSFIVYRYDVISSNYLRIGAVSNDSLSMFTDTARSIGGPNGGDPQYSNYQYKLAIRDTCGNIGALSPYHQSIFIQQFNQNFLWNAYSIGGSAPLNGYQFLRDDNGTGLWHVLVNTAGLATTDPNYLSYPNGKWRVQAIGLNCTPTRSAINKTRSNVKTLVQIGIQAQEDLLSTVKIYPNPAKEIVTFEISEILEAKNIKILNVLGEIVFNEAISAKAKTKTVKHINVSNLPKGIYSIAIETKNRSIVKELVIQ